MIWIACYFFSGAIAWVGPGVPTPPMSNRPFAYEHHDTPRIEYCEVLTGPTSVKGTRFRYYTERP
jgi:hypothetical protein